MVLVNSRSVLQTHKGSQARLMWNVKHFQNLELIFRVLNQSHRLLCSVSLLSQNIVIRSQQNHDDRQRRPRRLLAAAAVSRQYVASELPYQLQHAPGEDQVVSWGFIPKFRVEMSSKKSSCQATPKILRHYPVLSSFAMNQVVSIHEKYSLKKNYYCWWKWLKWRSESSRKGGARGTREASPSLDALANEIFHVVAAVSIVAFTFHPERAVNTKSKDMVPVLWSSSVKWHCEISKWWWMRLAIRDSTATRSCPLTMPAHMIHWRVFMSCWQKGDLCECLMHLHVENQSVWHSSIPPLVST